MAIWPDITALQDQLQSPALSGQKLATALLALESATEWIAERCQLYVVDADGFYVLDANGERVRVTSIPTPVRQAILLYAAKFYRRKDSPDGVAGTSENGLIRTGRYDSDAEQLLAPYLGLPGVA